jgi:hypothetical protein
LLRKFDLRRAAVTFAALALSYPALAQLQVPADEERTDNICQTFFRETPADREAFLRREFARLQRLHPETRVLIDNPLYTGASAACLARGLEVVLREDAGLCLADPRLQVRENAEKVKRDIDSVRALCLSYGPQRGPSAAQRIINAFD